MDVAARDCLDRFQTAEGRHGRSQEADASAVSQQTLHRNVIAFDPIGAQFPVAVPDAVEIRVVAVIELTDDAGVGPCLVSVNRDRPI